MVISGILILTMEGKTQDVIQTLEGFPGVEIHHVEGPKVIITLEASDSDESLKLSEQMEKVEGVLGVYLVSTHYEEDDDLDLEV